MTFGIKTSQVAIVLTVLTVLMGTAHCCQTAIDFGFSPCTFMVSYNGSDCYNFNFISCHWRQCVKRRRIGNKTRCVEYQDFTLSTYSDCTWECCDPDVVYAQNWSGIEECQDYLNKSLYLKLIIIFSILGGACVLFGLFCIVRQCCIKFQRCQRMGEILGACCSKTGECIVACCCGMVYIFTCKCFRRQNARVDVLQQIQIRNERGQPNIQDQVSRQSIPIERDRESTDFSSTKVQWRQKEGEEKVEDICCICLEGRVEVELECGHSFHKTCIATWLKKNWHCALCRTTVANSIKVYCHACRTAYFNVKLSELKGRIGIERMTCRNCQLMK